MNNKLNVKTLSVTAVMIAMVTVATGFLPRIPVPATGGYVHLGDIFVFFAAFAFGPLIGGVVGGVGCALADLLGGFAVWAPLTLVAHGVQGLVAGYLGKGKGPAGLIAGGLAGAACGVGLYFIGEALNPGYGGLAGALGEVVPNVIQFSVGAVAAIPLTLLIRKAYPSIEHIGARPEWREQ